MPDCALPIIVTNCRACAGSAGTAQKAPSSERRRQTAAYGGATVPKITVITRKAYGGPVTS